MKNNDIVLYCLKTLLPAHGMSIYIRFDPCNSCEKLGCSEKEIDRLLVGSDLSVKKLTSPPPSQNRRRKMSKIEEEKCVFCKDNACVALVCYSATKCGAKDSMGTPNYKVFEPNYTGRLEDLSKDELVAESHRLVDYPYSMPKPDESRLLTDEEIRASCLGDGVYWAGEKEETTTDPRPVLMPQFRNVAKAQLTKDQLHEQTRLERLFKEIEEHFKKVGYCSEEEYNWWQALKKQEGVK